MEHPVYYFVGAGCGCASGVLGGLFLLVTVLLILFRNHIGC